MQKDAYLLELARYIVLNPVRARMLRQAGRWPWSGYRATVGAEVGPDWLVTHSLSAFGDTGAEAIEKDLREARRPDHDPLRSRLRIMLGGMLTGIARSSPPTAVVHTR